MILLFLCLVSKLSLACSSQSINLSTRDIRHYTFLEKGKLITANDYGHFAFNVNFTNVEPLLNQLYQLTIIARNLSISAYPHADVFSALIDEEYRLLNNFYKNICKFFQPTRPRNSRNPDLIPSSVVEQSSGSPEGLSPETSSKPPSHNHIDAILENNTHQNLSSLNPGHQGRKRKKRTSSASSTTSLSRVKRFFGYVASLITGLIAGGTIFDLFDHSQISSLQSSLSETNQRQDQIIHMINKQSEAIMENRKDLIQIKKSVLKVMAETNKNANDIDLATLTVYARHVSECVRNTLELYVGTIEAASNQKLHFGLLSHSDAVNALKKVTALAKPRGLVPLISDPHQILQLPVSIAMQDHGFIIFCHIPLARPENFLTLYSYQPFPITLTSRSQLTIKPPKSLLAISPDRHHIELSSHDLESCTKLGPKVTTCPHLNMLSSPSRPSCLSSLFFAHHESAKNICKLFVSPANDHVLPINRNTFLTYTSKVSTYAIKCYNGTHKEGLQLMTLDKVTVPDNCVAVLPGFRLSPKSDLYVESTHQSYLWMYPMEKLLSHPEREVLDLVIDAHASDEISFPHLKRLTRDQLNISTQYSFPMAVIAAIFAFAAMTCFVGLCWCFCQSKDKYVALSQLQPSDNLHKTLNTSVRKKSLEQKENSNENHLPDPGFDSN